MIIYRLELSQAPIPRPLAEGRLSLVADLRGVRAEFPLWVKNWGWKAAIKTGLKVLSGRRILYCSISDQGTIIQSAWANLGFCRYYPVEPGSIVFGTMFVRPEFRGRGYSPNSKSQAMAYLYQKGYRLFYADTSEANVASQRAIEKLGFLRINADPSASPAKPPSIKHPLAFSSTPVDY